MDKRMLLPAEIAQSTVNSAINKARLPIYKMILLGIFAGIFIGFGAHADITIMQTMKNIDVGMMKFFGAMVFPVGLMLVVIAGGELFTGNNLMTLALMNKKISLKELTKNWCFVYLGNFIGSLLLAYFVSKSGLVTGQASELAIGIAKGKVSISIEQAIIRGALCNMVVVLAVWISTGAKDIISKIFACWFPIMLFVLVGYEHSVANMFFIPLGKMLGANITWGQIWFNNLIPVTIGNIIGGGIVVPLVYYLCYLAPSEKK